MLPLMEISTRMIDRLEVDLMAARRTGEVCAYVVPFSENYSEAVEVSDALVAALRARDLTIKVTTRRCPEGVALVLADTTPITA